VKTDNLSLAEIQRQQRKKFKRQKRNAELEDKAELRMTSLMDIFVNVLIYLLMNYSSSPIDVAQTDESKLPSSTTTLPIQHHATVGITTRVILVNREKVCDVRDGTVDPSLKQDGQPSSYLILPLLEKLKDAANRRKKLAKFNSAIKFDGILIVVADHRMPFRLLSEIMYTAGQAEFGKFNFAVIQTGKGL
jgi:hypothetical protein